MTLMSPLVTAVPACPLDLYSAAAATDVFKPLCDGKSHLIYLSKSIHCNVEVNVPEFKIYFCKSIVIKMYLTHGNQK